MESLYDYKRFAILYVDDEEKSLKYFQRAFGDEFHVLTASGAAEAFALMQSRPEEIGVLVTDEKMPGERGVELLEKARQFRPQIMRILVTAYSDLDAIVEAVNRGAIYKYFSKPWQVAELEGAFRRALEFFIVQRERDFLLREKVAAIRQMMVRDRVVSLGLVAAGFGHHIRNSLVAVRTFLDLAPMKLQEEIFGSESLRNPNFWMDFYKHVQNQVQRITELLNDLGGATSAGPAQFPDRVELPRVIADVIEKLAPKLAEKKIVLENRVAAELPSLWAQREKFCRLFELLLTDEVDYLPEGGRVILTASANGSGRLGDQEIVAQIEDNGPGLPEEVLRSVFDPFFLRHDNPQEFGIKLMTCFFIVYHHGGRIEVKNSSGEGIRFLIHLPVNPQAPNRQADESYFVSKVLMNDELWNRAVSGI